MNIALSMLQQRNKVVKVRVDGTGITAGTTVDVTFTISVPRNGNSVVLTPAQPCGVSSVAAPEQGTRAVTVTAAVSGTQVDSTVALLNFDIPVSPPGVPDASCP